MFLKRLVELSERPDYAPPPEGYGPLAIRYLIELDGEGRLLSPTPVDTADPSRREARRGQTYLAPALRRGSAVRALLLADNATYVLGMSKGPSERETRWAASCHQAFTELVSECAAATGDPGAAAVDAFLNGGGLQQLALDEAFDATANLTFRVDGRLPFEASAIQRYWARRNEPQENVMQCVVCGERRPALERLQTVIKGIPGGQSSGTAIISFNESAYESYGLEASLNAPICAECAARSHHTLNRLLRDEQHRLIIGGSILVCWTREPTDVPFLEVLSQPTPEDVRRLMLSPYGVRAAPVEGNRFYAALLGASGGRAQIRSWLDATVDEAQKNLAKWFSRQRIVDRWGAIDSHLGISELAMATVRVKDALAPHLVSTLFMAALGGHALAADVSLSVLRRIRVGPDKTKRETEWVQHRHAAMLKLAICSQRPEWEDTMSQLDLTNTSPAYLCGRLLAELEEAQRRAIEDVGASIIDRYYGTASSAPATVFGTLLANAQSHLAKLERDNRGAYGGIQAAIEDILASLDSFPTTLTLIDQSLFALGYYHQRAHNRAQAIAHKQEAQA